MTTEYPIVDRIDLTKNVCRKGLVNCHRQIGIWGLVCG